MYSLGDDRNKLGEYAWCRENATSAGEAYAHQVADKKPNPWGLHDMNGNVLEWCRDWHQDKPSGGTDPEVLAKAAGRVYRGGSWHHAAGYCRSAYRYRDSSNSRYFTLGFRVAAVQLSK